MFTAYLFNNFKSFALLQKMFIFAEIVDGVLMAFLPLLSELVYFQDKKFYVFISVVPFLLAKIANQF